MSNFHIDKLPVNWFDVVVIITLLLGFNRGRKNGMSQELMVSLQWVAIVFVCGFGYRPVGDYLVTLMPVSHLFAYILSYVFLAILVKMSFSFVKKGLGGKLVGSDVFGRSEYYLGMIFGGIRFLCILLAALALLNARFYSPQELAAARAFQNDVYGSNFFPELSSVQVEVFKGSLVGSMVKSNAGPILIAATHPEIVQVKRRKDDLP